MSTAIAPSGLPSGASTYGLVAPPLSMPPTPVTKPPGTESPGPLLPSKQEHKVDARGVNPSFAIDPDTHIVVMTISGTDGKAIKQIPNKQELEAYKTKH